MEIDYSWFYILRYFYFVMPQSISIVLGPYLKNLCQGTKKVFDDERGGVIFENNIFLSFTSYSFLCTVFLYQQS